MKSSRLVTSLVFMNVLLIMFLVAEHTQSLFAQPGELPILRGRGLEIVDDQGLVRASIIVHGPEIVDGRRYARVILTDNEGHEKIFRP
jgi:hypothetical protein